MTPPPATRAPEEALPPRSAGLAVVAAAAAVALLYYGRHLFVIVAFALFLSFAMRPFVSLLERAGVPRVIAILLLIFLLTARHGGSLALRADSCAPFA